MENDRTDGCTLIPWRGGKPVAWDVTVCTTQWPIPTWPLQGMQQEPSPNKLLTGSV